MEHFSWFGLITALLSAGVAYITGHTIGKNKEK